MIQTIIEEMARGNFSFLILAVGIIQLILMVRNGNGDRNERISGSEVSNVIGNSGNENNGNGGNCQNFPQAGGEREMR